ncbi:outer dense fiber protein 3-like protein 2 [Homalodisca vitripennis]|uniref:outer dense fiber protein 3-like protein 2 n=1 Tax=Homalodisca vitripennis TaxID=197043 RepID=UPI001EEA43BC|nr:outer dense fiber protein 3-like protein 2 [Homalodisca vitripennis]
MAAKGSKYHQSPGPNAYKLPPLVGYKKHDISKWKNPAYSMGITTKNLQKHIGPGPAYKIERMTRYGKAYLPTTLLGKRLETIGKPLGPGPGAYNPDLKKIGKVKHIGPTFGIRPDPPLRSLGPGPSAYHVKKNPMIKTPPAYSLGIRPDLTRAHLGPGPNAYNPKRQDNVNTVKFGPPHKKPRAKDTGPGPGAYQGPQFMNYREKVRPPKYPFGVKTDVSPYITPEDNAVCELICRRE